MRHDTAEQRAVLWSSLPPRARILDRMSDLLLCVDDVRAEVESEAHAIQDVRAIRTVMERVFDDVNGLMKQLSD